MFPLLALLVFGLSVVHLGRQRDYKGLGLSALSIGVERHYKLTESLWPPQVVHYPSIEYVDIEVKYPPVPSRVLDIGPPLHPLACNISTQSTGIPTNDCVDRYEKRTPYGNRSYCRVVQRKSAILTFHRTCPETRTVEPETKDLAIWHNPHATGHEPIDFALFLWLGMMMISIFIVGCGIFWDNHRSFLALLRFLRGDERLDGENMRHGEGCTANCWNSNIPPLEWIGRFTSLQKEYNKIKAKNGKLRARLQSKRVHSNELARKTIFLRREKLHYTEVIKALCRKLKDVDNSVDEMRQFFKLAMAFEKIESEEDKVRWEEHLAKFKRMGPIPLVKELRAKGRAKAEEYCRRTGRYQPTWRGSWAFPADWRARFERWRLENPGKF